MTSKDIKNLRLLKKGGRKIYSRSPYDSPWFSMRFTVFYRHGFSRGSKRPGWMRETERAVADLVIGWYTGG